MWGTHSCAGFAGHRNQHWHQLWNEPQLGKQALYQAAAGLAGALLILLMTRMAVRRITTTIRVQGAFNARYKNL